MFGNVLVLAYACCTLEHFARKTKDYFFSGRFCFINYIPANTMVLVRPLSPVEQQLGSLLLLICNNPMVQRRRKP